MENVAVLTEDETSTLFFRPHPWGFDIQGKNKNMLMPGGQPGRGGGGGRWSWAQLELTDA